MDGIELISALRKSEPFIPLIAISGRRPYSQLDYLKLARMLGAQHTFHKPIDFPALMQTVRGLCLTSQTTSFTASEAGQCPSYLDTLSIHLELASRKDTVTP
jgi:CheY-like chemotaxis protein